MKDEGKVGVRVNNVVLRTRIGGGSWEGSYGFRGVKEGFGIGIVRYGLW